MIADQSPQRRGGCRLPPCGRPLGYHAEGPGPRALHRALIALAEPDFVLAGLVGDEFEALELVLRDYLSAGFCPLDEPVNLSLRPAAACVRTCSSEGFGRLAKAARVAMSFGCGGKRFLLMPRILHQGREKVNPREPVGLHSDVADRFRQKTGKQIAGELEGGTPLASPTEKIIAETCKAARAAGERSFLP